MKFNVAKTKIKLDSWSLQSSDDLQAHLYNGLWTILLFHGNVGTGMGLPAWMTC